MTNDSLNESILEVAEAMIRNGVIEAQKEFAERRYIAETDRHFEVIKAQANRERGVDIECARDVYRKAQGKIFALIGDTLVNTYQIPPLICEYTTNQSKDAKPVGALKIGDKNFPIIKEGEHLFLAPKGDENKK